MEKTLGIIKPDAVERNLIGKIVTMIEDSGLQLVAAKLIYLIEEEVEEFYEVHKDRPFFNSLVEYMSSGPIFVMVLEGEKAVEKYRKLMGATNPKDAAEGTIRKNFAIDIEKNSVHGSDSLENAENEIDFFFDDFEIMSFDEDEE